MTTRLDVRKTYKLYIGGKFPRSESGRSFAALDARGEVIARVALGSRKDLRDAVRAARTASESWAGRSGYNRGQILYRIAEMVEDRREVFVEQVRRTVRTQRQAEREVAKSIDRLVWYAGWCDKYVQVVGNLNPVSGPFFNISTPEPVGVVGIVCPDEPALLGLVSRLAPALVAGNTTVVVGSTRWPMPTITLGEALATADVPGGVVNLLTGYREELLPFLASHMDVNAVDAWGLTSDQAIALEEAAADNVKRVHVGTPPRSWTDDRSAQSPHEISRFTEIKTVWHPKGL